MTTRNVIGLIEQLTQVKVSYAGNVLGTWPLQQRLPPAERPSSHQSARILAAIPKQNPCKLELCLCAAVPAHRHVKIRCSSTRINQHSRVQNECIEKWMLHIGMLRMPLGVQETDISHVANRETVTTHFSSQMAHTRAHLSS